MQIQFTKQAEGDLEDIWNYTLETWGHRQAERYIGDIQRSLAEISSHPHRIKKPFPQNKNVESFNPTASQIHAVSRCGFCDETVKRAEKQSG